MFDLIDFKETQFYKDVERQVKQRIAPEIEKKVELRTKLNMIPAFLELGLTPQQIAEELELDLQLIYQSMENQNHENP